MCSLWHLIKQHDQTNDDNTEGNRGYPKNAHGHGSTKSKPLRDGSKAEAFRLVSVSTVDWLSPRFDDSWAKICGRGWVKLVTKDRLVLHRPDCPDTLQLRVLQNLKVKIKSVPYWVSCTLRKLIYLTGISMRIRQSLPLRQFQWRKFHFLPLQSSQTITQGTIGGGW